MLDTQNGALLGEKSIALKSLRITSFRIRPHQSFELVKQSAYSRSTLQ
ncbi:hypothetical protein EBME_0143 [bacterium endosymbiont of Mortierella elongata FMR23-6]|nr:hypothetical protein EBME_0143 [bacterium endosymbiont of Mortierella elongata FMR23-6]